MFLKEIFQALKLNDQCIAVLERMIQFPSMHCNAFFVIFFQISTFCVAILSCWGMCMLLSFHIAFFFVLHSIHVAFFSCCNLCILDSSILNSFHVALISCCFLSCCTYLILHVFPGYSLSRCNFSMSHASTLQFFSCFIPLFLVVLFPSFTFQKHLQSILVRELVIKADLAKT